MIAARRLAEAAGALVGGAALVLQLYLLLRLGLAKGASTTATVIEFFSYFTILGNLLAVLVYVAALMGGATGAAQFFARAGVKSAVALYIVVVGLVYVAVLRVLWDPQGLAKLADVALHYVTPLYYLVYWLLFVDKSRLAYGDVPRWLIFPIVYAVYAVVRGVIAGIYPYPFLEIGKLGLWHVALNIVVLIVVFGLVGAILVGVGRALSPRPSVSA
ncbi:MAG: Pr6Pr family membrane protein [Rhodospirillaceae bacterium]|nr:Pr6Pr family membrane protein [Rhodospirillaceae bacterium]